MGNVRIADLELFAQTADHESLEKGLATKKSRTGQKMLRQLVDGLWTTAYNAQQDFLVGFLREVFGYDKVMIKAHGGYIVSANGSEKAPHQVLQQANNERQYDKVFDVLGRCISDG